MAQLITDLRQRGMLDKTLVIWMGEFGRTPRINARGGRDHYPRAFNVALAGGGIRGGQVVGQTDAGGEDVTKRPVTVSDLFRTIYTTLGIDADHENMSRIGRPIKLVDGGQIMCSVLTNLAEGRDRGIYSRWDYHRHIMGPVGAGDHEFMECRWEYHSLPRRPAGCPYRSL